MHMHANVCLKLHCVLVVTMAIVIRIYMYSQVYLWDNHSVIIIITKLYILAEDRFFTGLLEARLIVKPLKYQSPSLKLHSWQIFPGYQNLLDHSAWNFNVGRSDILIYRVANSRGGEIDPVIPE